MTVTNGGLANVALLLAGSGTIPAYMSIGSGSGTQLIGLSALYAEIGSRKSFSDRDILTANQITWQADWTSVEMSGLSLREFGLNKTISGADLQHYVNFETPIVFNGSIENRLVLRWTIFEGE